MWWKLVDKDTWQILFFIITCIKVSSAFDCVEHLNRMNHSVSYQPGLCTTLEMQHKAIENYISKRQSWQTSNLGTILYKFVDPYIFKLNNDVTKTHLVLFWSSWLQLLERHSWRTRPTRRNLAWTVDLGDCSVDNCLFSGNKALLNQADAIVIDIDRNVISLPHERNSKQIWIYKVEHPAMDLPLRMSTDEYLIDLQNLFNWSMTYRSDSDIPIPYGRTVPLPTPELVLIEHTESVLQQLVPYWYEKQSVIPAAVLISNCNIKKHLKFVYELRKYMRVDAIGPCFDSFNCAGDLKKDCKVLRDYMFYVVLESYSCRQYLTERCFHNAYSKGAIPVIMGPTVDDCEKLLPPNSFLHTDNYLSVQDLAEHIKRIMKNPVDILFYHDWRRNFKVVNEHGYFETPSPFFCRICEALNYNDVTGRSYVFDELKLYFSRALTCNVTYLYNL